MKCPNCGFNSFDYLEECKKCKLPLNPAPEYKTLYKSTQKDESLDSDRDTQSNKSKDLDSYEMTTGLDTEHGVPVYKRAQEPEPVHTRDIPIITESSQPEVPETEEEIGAISSDPELYSESLTPVDATNQNEIQEPSQETESYSIAALKPRAAAFIIDLLIVGLISYFAIEAGFYFMGRGDVESLEVQRIFLPIYVLLFFLASTYFIFLHYYAGTTVGKMLFGIKIISSDGSDIGLWESFMRWVGYYISAAFLLAGFIWSIFDRESQAWHDKIAGTYVVKG